MSQRVSLFVFHSNILRTLETIMPFCFLSFVIHRRILEKKSEVTRIQGKEKTTAKKLDFLVSRIL